MAEITEQIRQAFEEHKKKSSGKTAYIKLPDGKVVNNPPTPTQAWTPEEWAAEIDMREKLLAQFRKQQPVPKEKPDQECLDLWNSTLPQPPEQIAILEKELAEMRKV